MLLMKKPINVRSLTQLCLSYYHGRKIIWRLWQDQQRCLNNWDIKNQDVYYARLHLDEIFAMPSKFLKYQPISGFPAMCRDVSLAVKKEIPYKKIEEICLQHGGDILRSVNLLSNI